MAELRDSFLRAVEAILEKGGGLQFFAAPTTCCQGRVADGPAGCTCWEPIYDRTQNDPDTEAGFTTRHTLCDDCAYRPGSPEKTGQETHEGDTELLEQLAANWIPFHCHDGMRKPIAWQHPAGMTILVAADRDGDYQPPIVKNVPYQANGQPGLLCAGWDARRRALTPKTTQDC